jgi:hypothetical protein
MQDESVQNQVVQIKSSKRNRKRSKRRAILCPIHGCHMESVSQKHSMYADTVGQLHDRGISHRTALLLMATHTTVHLTGEWLEAFWCEYCQQKIWYHVKRLENATYNVQPAPADLWHQAQGVIHPHGNPSVSEFTRTAANMSRHGGIRDFKFVV